MDSAGLFGPVKSLRRQLDGPATHARNTAGGIQKGLAVPQRGLCPNPVGDVARHADRCDHPPLRVEDRRLDRVPALRHAVEADHRFIGDVERLARAEHPRVVAQVLLRDVGRDERRVDQPLQLLGAHAVVIQKGAIGPDDLGTWALDQNGLGDRVQHLPVHVQLLALRLHGELGTVKFGDVGVRDHHAAGVPAEGGDAEAEPALFGGRVAGVLQIEAGQPSSEHSQDAGKRGFGLGSGRRARGFLADRQVARSHARAGCRLPGLGSVLFGKALPRFVDGDDDAVAVQHGDLGTECVQDRRQQTLRLVQPGLGALALGDVQVSAEHPPGPTVGVAARDLASRQHPDPVPVLVAQPRLALVSRQFARDMLLQQGFGTEPILLVREGVPGGHRGGTQFSGRVAHDLRAALVEPDGAGLEVPLPGADVGACDDPAQPFASLSRFTACCPAGHQCQHERHRTGESQQAQHGGEKAHRRSGRGSGASNPAGRFPLARRHAIARSSAKTCWT